MSRKDVIRRRRRRQDDRRRRLGRLIRRGRLTVDKAKRYGRAVRRWIKAGRPVLSDDQAAARLAVCQWQCAYFEDDRQTCTLCGCSLRPGGALATVVAAVLGRSVLALAAKTYMATEDCPEKKWPEI